MKVCRKLVTLAVLVAVMLAPAALALATTTTDATAAAPVIDWGTLITQVVVWIIGAIAAVGAWALKRYVYPWFLTAAVPWLKTHNLIALADVAVKYAEAQLGRYVGPEKWKLALSLMQAEGFDVESEDVIAALKAAWKTLDLQQISAGVKD